jgi:succinate dehydrogenase/fumarate reductase flavoprotein subunit
MAAALRSKLKQLPNIEIVEDAMALELWCDDHGTVSGCLVWDMAHNRFVAIGAKAVVLATGGYAQLWKFTDTGPDLTGDGVWLAYRQGAVLCDLEMSLYYPTCLKWPPEIVGTLVQYEGLVNPRYGGAPLVNAWGQPIIEPGLPPVRDEMMRIMVSESAAGRGTPHGGVLIDTPHAIRGPKEFLAIIRKLDSLPYNQLRDFHWDVTQTPLEVAPGIHFTLGGVTINEKAETSVPGLYAAGEVSANVHGANRTSGNALAETQVFGKRAGEHAAQWALERSAHAPTAANAIEPAARRWQSIVDRPLSPVRPHQVKESLREVMDRYMGYQRDDAGMSAGVREIQRLREEVLPFMCVRDREVMSYEWREAYEVYMMVDLADLVLRSGRMRQESRGHHWRTDFPEQRDEWCKHTTVVMGKDHAPIFGDRPVVRLTAGAVNAEAKPARGGAPSCL